MGRLISWLFGLRRYDLSICKILQLLQEILRKEDKIMSQLGDTLNSIKDQVGKATVEILGKIADLEAALANAGTIPVDAQTALDGLKVAAQALDDIVPDAPVV